MLHNVLSIRVMPPRRRGCRSRARHGTRIKCFCNFIARPLRHLSGKRSNSGAARRDKQALTSDADDEDNEDDENDDEEENAAEDNVG